MCIEDIRIGRTARYSARSVTITAAANQVLASPNNERITLLIASADSGTTLVSPKGDVTNAAGVGWVVAPTAPPVDRRIEDGHADVMAEWRGFSAAGATVLVIETFLDVTTKLIG